MRISDWSSDVCSSDLADWPWKALGPVTFAAPPMSFMNRSMLSPTLAWSGVTTRLVAARASAAVRSLVIMAGFLRGQEKDAVMQFIGRQDAVSDRDRAPRFAVPPHQGRRDLGLQAHARALPARDRVVRDMTRRATVGGTRPHCELPATELGRASGRDRV